MHQPNDLFIKRSAEGRDNDGTMNLPMISVERTTVSKDLNKTTAYYGPTPFFIDSIHGSYIRINKRIVEDKTNNFAVADNIKNSNGVKRTRMDKLTIQATIRKL